MCQSKKELKLTDKVLVQGNKCDMGNKNLKILFPKKLSIVLIILVVVMAVMDPRNQVKTLEVIHTKSMSTLMNLKANYPNFNTLLIQKTSLLRTMLLLKLVMINFGFQIMVVNHLLKFLFLIKSWVSILDLLLVQLFSSLIRILFMYLMMVVQLSLSKAPSSLSSQVYRAVSFHYTNAKEFIWFGEDCSNGKCTVNAYYTDDAGASFNELMKNVKTCDFVGSIFEKPNKVIYCSSPNDRRLEMFSLESPSSQPEKVFDNIVGFALTGNYVVVATIDEKKNSLLSKVSVDGTIFADADFPHDLKVGSHQAFTVLDSSSKAIFMHVTTSEKPNFEYGPLLKSNSNGTYFVVSLDNVNRNTEGYVDFDKIDGLEGTIIANVVANAKDGQGEKKLQTLISHNDGSEWNYLVPPAVDSEGKKYPCSGQSLSKCALHLHGFTERADYRDTFPVVQPLGS